MACGSMQGAHLTASDLEEAADDPTLADCCRRDLQQQAKTSRLVNELRRNDRTTERIMAAQRVLAAEDPLATDPATICCERQGTSACCQDSELGRLRHKRMQQLRAEATRHRDAAALQYGVLHETPQEDALVRMYVEHLSHRDQLTSGSGRLPPRARSAALYQGQAANSQALMQLAQLCVCHMAGGGVAADLAMDQALQSLARLHQQALFLRAPFERDGPLAQRCNMPGPGLVCLRDGTPIAAGPHQAFTAGGSLPDSGAISAWLQLAGVLTSQTDAHLATPPAPATEAAEADDWQEPCALCGRTYTHQHVQPATPQSDWSHDDT